jgi:hypothetical protein
MHTVARAAGPVALAVLGLLGRAVIAYADSRPAADSTGLTVVSLVGLAALVAFMARRRPWLWALLVGAPTPLVEIPVYHDPSPVAALLFAALGATAGWLLGRAATAGQPADR